MRILILNGHDKFGNGGASSKLYGNEETLTRDFSNFLKIELDRVGNTTTIFNPTIEDKSAYTRLKKGETINFLNYDYVIELHFNSKGGDSSRDGRITGSEILLHPNATNIQLAKDILISLDDIGMMSRGVKFRNDLLVLNTVYASRIPYMLWEICFIDDNDDMNFYMSRRQLLSKTFARHFSQIGGELYTVNINDNEVLPLYSSDNIRDRSVLTNIPNHDRIEMITYNEKMSKVSYNNTYTGYVETKKLFRIWKGITIANLNVRENASENSKPITILSKNTEITVLHTRVSPTGDNWLYIRNNNTFGYVHPKYVKVK